MTIRRNIQSKFIHFVQYIGERYGLMILPRIMFLKLIYKHKTGNMLNIKEPSSFCEKIQWLKLNDHNPVYSIMADKYAVKSYVQKLTGFNLAIPTIGIFDNVSEINPCMLPEKFIIKCTHDWNSVIICRDKSSFDFVQAFDKLNKALKLNHYYRSLEWAYKNIKPRIIIEPFLSEDGTNPPIDYRVYCFHGTPYMIHLTLDKLENRQVLFYNTKWDLIDIEREGLLKSRRPVSKPLVLDEMLNAASIISKDIPFLRVDFYIVHNHLFLGECTFYPAEGFKSFLPLEWNLRLGEMIKICNSN